MSSELTGTHSEEQTSIGPGPTVAAILPNFNHAEFVGGAIEALLSQTSAFDEIIVIDDASTDHSIEVIERACAGHGNARVFRNPRNIGVVESLNLGLREAHTSHVLLAAADDMVLPHLIERVLPALQAYPNAGLCCGDPVVLDEETGQQTRLPLPLPSRAESYTPEELEQLLLRRNFQISTGASVLRRDAALTAGGLSPDLAWHSDWFLDFVLAFRYGFCYVPEPLTVKRMSAGRYSDQRHDWKAQEKVLREIIYRVGRDDHRDVAPNFRRAAALPTYPLRAFGLLMRDPRLRPYLSLLLAWRLLSYETLSALGRVLPWAWRQKLRLLFRI